MRIKTNVKAGAITRNHNEKLVCASRKSKRLKVKTGVKAGAITRNHNERLVRDTAIE
jgi:hypothetical protein